MNILPPIKPAIKMIVDSLNQNPDAWRASSYELRHGKGEDAVTVWVANGRSGLKIDLPSGYPLNWRERRLLWKTFIAWRDTPRGTETIKQALGLKAVK